MDLVIIATLSISWLYTFFRKGAIVAVSFLFVASTVAFFLFASSAIDVLLKALFAISFISLIKKSRRKGIVSVFILLLLLFAFINARYAIYDSTFKRIDCFTAYFSLFTGIFLQIVVIKEDKCKYLLETLSRLAIYSLLLGIPLSLLGFKDYLGRWGTAIAGASISTDLSFFGTLGAAAALFYYKLYRNPSYRYLAYINFFIVCSTLTRGGILATAIILSFDFIPFVISIIKNKKYYFAILLSSIISIPAISYILEALSIRNEAGDSGRSEAWAMLILLQENFWIGNGYGFLKTRDDHAIIAFTAAHNEYLHLFVEIGIIGIIIISFLFFILFRNILKNSPIPRLLLIMFFISFMTYSYTDNTITNFRFWIPFMTLLMILQNINKKI